MITLKEAFEDLYDRMVKQLAETIWNIKRVKPMSQKEVEIFQGKGVIKKKLMKDLKIEFKERGKNLAVLEKIIKRYGKN